MNIGDHVEITRGPLGAYYSPDPEAWGPKFDEVVEVGAHGEIVDRSIHDWWVVRVSTDVGDRFVPAEDVHLALLKRTTLGETSDEDGWERA